MNENKYPKVCHWCKNRNWNCSFKYKINNCSHWKKGKCLTCLYYKNGEEFTEKETDMWFKRGCETFFPDAKKFCHSYIPFNKFTYFVYKKIRRKYE